MMRCEICGADATTIITDLKEINGGHVAGQEHLPPMIHKQHVPVGLCAEHMREPKLIRDEELHKLRDAHIAARADAK